MDAERWANLAEVAVPINLVLVVEDDSDSAQFLKILLERQGVKVRIAKDGGQAQATFVMNKPDFVILDLMLPGESGFEICERLKHTDDSIPILILSAIEMDEAQELARKVGADGYLTKPYNPEELVSKMREVANAAWERSHLQLDPDPTRVDSFVRAGRNSKSVQIIEGKA